MPLLRVDRLKLMYGATEVLTDLPPRTEIVHLDIGQPLEDNLAVIAQNDGRVPEA